MATTDPIFLQYWDRLADRVAAVRATGIAVAGTAGVTFTMASKASLGAPGRVLKGYGPFPPQLSPAVYCYPPKVRSGDGNSLGSFMREVTYPVLGFCDGLDDTSESRVKEAAKWMHDIQIAIETDRASQPAFNGLPIIDCTLSSGEVDDLVPFGVMLGVFFFTVVATFEVPMAQRGL